MRSLQFTDVGIKLGFHVIGIVFFYCFNKRFGVVYGDIGQNTMPQIHNITIFSKGINHFFHFMFNCWNGREQPRGSKLPLQCDFFLPRDSVHCVQNRSNQRPGHWRPDFAISFNANQHPFPNTITGLSSLSAVIIC